jgi:16S rRNA (cytidine1402-2'-O)-methyltransferase
VTTLYLVATPIGNLEDITARALRVLSEVHLIAAEDTRQTGKLLKHYDIQTQPTSYHEHNKDRELPTILKALETGDVALVSDAGTPALNDPGYELVRAALEAGHQVSPIPGPSAPVAALVASGLPTDKFLYLGYIPRKSSARRRAFSQVASLPYTLIFLETPHRLLEALEDMQESLGDRQVAVARELTKLHEEIYRGRLSDAGAHFSAQPARGEITLVVAGASPNSKRWGPERVRIALKEALSSGEAPSQIARQLAAQSGWKRRDLYDLIKELQGKQ